VVSFPNCKINLGLNVLRKRNDGFHDIETLFYPIPLYDVLEIIPADKQSGHHETSLSISGINIEGNKEGNICIKAYRLLKKDFHDLPAVQMHLHKVVPTGAGLGGGSADAAFTLRLLDKNCNLNLSISQLVHYALQLGSDCPFFIFNKPCYAIGRGELLEPAAINLNSFKLVLVNPGIHIHTANAFAKITPSISGRSIKEITRLPVNEWKNELKNDFEEGTFTQYPEIKKIKDELYQAGAEYASMSGSGSTVYGIFKKDHNAQFSFPSHYYVRELNG
jgi:4-diphosphocytidyl-2-C-methyl-D-erythritol kinase